MKMDKNIFLEGILREQAKNLRYLLILAVEAGKVLSFKSRNDACDYMLHDMEKDNKHTFVCLYDSKLDDNDSLNNALSFISEEKYQLCGNVSWIPGMA